MKIKILKSVSAARKIHPKDSTPDLETKLAEQLIKDGYAVEHVEPEQKPDENGSAPDRKSLFKQYGKCSVEELTQVKASAEAVLATEPNRADAKEVVEVITELLKKKLK
jgi:3-hydroxyacyl-CoA dehydrogenase